MDCILPAASILGAKDVFSAIELLPLSVPAGKPILSCNATSLKQTQVKISDEIFSCIDGLISVECIDGFNGNLCPGKILVCDIQSSKELTCTNGTLMSRGDLECGSISLGNPKSTLNCGFKIDVRVDNSPTTTTRAPIKRPTKATTIPAPVTEDYDEFTAELEQQTNRINLFENEEDENLLIPQIKKAAQNVFPHNLFVKPLSDLQPPRPYLPPFESSASRDAKEGMDGVFPMNLLVIGKSIESSTARLSGAVSNNQQTNSRVNGGNQQTIVDPIGFKTQITGIDTRFGGGNQQQRPIIQQDFRDRLIFTN